MRAITDGRRRARAVASLVVGLGLVGAACGGGAPTVEDFTADADAICQAHRATIDEAVSGVMAGGELPDPAQFGQLAMGTIIPETQEQLDELAALEAPDEIADEVDAYVSEGRSVLDGLQQDPSLLTDPTNFSEVNGAADTAGLPSACRIGPG